jgi:uncharacterized protein YabE (DUF348 family)
MDMRRTRFVSRRFTRAAGGLNLTGSLNAVLSVNNGESRNARASASSRQTIVQRNGMTVIDDDQNGREPVG